MNDYKVEWRDDSGETHEEFIRADRASAAEMQVFQENENCMEIVETIKV